MATCNEFFYFLLLSFPHKKSYMIIIVHIQHINLILWKKTYAFFYIVYFILPLIMFMNLFEVLLNNCTIIPHALHWKPFKYISKQLMSEQFSRLSLTYNIYCSEYINNIWRSRFYTIKDLTLSTKLIFFCIDHLLLWFFTLICLNVLKNIFLSSD